jgi:hypothetical protein
MLRFIKRRLAIRSYVWKLSQELCRRFGKKRYYTVDQVARVAKSAGFKTAFIAYAHAIFCTRKDFDAYYGRLKLDCTYDGVRAVVSRRYFGGVRDFDAASIIRATRRMEISGGFYESGAGYPGVFTR